MTAKTGLEVLGALGLVLIIFVLSACDSGNPAGFTGGDSDSDSESAQVCMMDSQCSAGQCCHGSTCVSCDAIPCYPPDDACRQDTDCNAAEYCTDSCACEGSPDGDNDDGTGETDGPDDKSCEYMPCISWKPTYLEFPLVQYGESGLRTLTIFNDGAETLQLYTVQIGPEGDSSSFTFSTDDVTQSVVSGGITDIKSGENIQIGIIFTRDAPGQKTSVLHITSNDQRNNKTNVTIDLVATVKGETEIRVSPTDGNGAPYHDFGAVDVGSEQGLDVIVTCLPYQTVAEESNAVCTVNALQFDPPNGAFYLGSTVGLPKYLRYNETLNIPVKFNPIDAGTDEAILKIYQQSDYSSYNPTNPIEFTLVGEGVEPCLTLVPTFPEPLNFGDVTVGVTVSLPVTMKSTCGGTVVVNKIWWWGNTVPEAFVIGGLGTQDPQNLNIRIPSGNEVEFMVNCTPPNLFPQTAQIQIESNDSSKPLQVLNVQCQGVNAQIRVNPAIVDFGQVLVNNKKEATLRLENIGSGNVRIYDIVIDKRLDGSNNPIPTDRPDVFRLSDIDQAVLPMDLPGMNNLEGEDNFYEFTFEYNPDTETISQVDFARAVIMNDSSSPEFSVTMRGEPVAPHVEWWLVEEGYEDSIFTEEINFGDTNMGTTASRNLRIKNVGEATLDCTLAFGPNTSADFGMIMVDLSGIDSNEYRDVPLSYMPSLPYPGPDSGTLIFQCNDRNHSNQTINLAGKGVDPRFCIDPSTSISNPWVFGPLYLYDTSVPKQIKIWNCGSGVLIINDWDFNQVGIPDSWIVDNWSMEFPVYLRPHTQFPSDEFTFTVQYTPNGVKPSQPMSIRFTTNSIDGNTRYVWFKGSGKDCDPCWYDLDSGVAGCEYQCHMPPGVACGDTGVEVCDGYDNDCNGGIDDPWPIGEACEGLGECGAGTYICATKTTVKCSSEQWPPNGQMSQDWCDGKDNNCDGFTDESYEIGKPCAVGVGICTVGQWQCYPPGDPNYPMGRRCSAWDMAQTEKCDYIDNDCDGKTDNGTFVNTLAPGNPPCTNCVGVQCDAAGECDWGFYRCGYGVGPNDEPAGTWIECFSPGVGDPEICDGLDNNCNSVTDENFPEKGTPCDGEGECGTGVYECSPYTVYETICTTENPYNPLYEGVDETCNFKDDDCDGMTDEDFNINGECYAPGVCGQVQGKWECNPATGERRCSTAPGGTQHYLVPGALAQEGPAWGKCDKLDNDCDGEIDEGYGVGVQCDGIGACGIGVIECKSDGFETQCSTDQGGSDWLPKVEVCNGLDDDCNNLADDRLFPDKDGNMHNVGAPCDGVGECGDGVYQCANLNQVRCSTLPGGTQYPGSQDVCDGLDNDCDGCTDQGYVNYTGNCQPIPCVGVGECGAGHYQCLPESHPDYPDVYDKMCDTMPYGDNDQSQPEECDGLDNDCDGFKDEDFETCCDPNNCGACNYACNVPHGTPGCANYKCTIASCNTGWYDINGVVDNDGCECQVDANDFQGSGNECGVGIGQAIQPTPSNLLDNDGGHAVTVSGNITPIGDVDWYTFVAVDGAEADGTGCDEFYASVRFTNNPGGQYAFQVYKNTCNVANAACPDEQRDAFSYRTDMQEDTPGSCGSWDPQQTGIPYDPNPACYKGHCPCDPIDNPVNEHEGRNYCFLEDVRFFVKVYRRTGITPTCENYTIEFSNGVYSSN